MTKYYFLSGIFLILGISLIGFTTSCKVDSSDGDSGEPAITVPIVTPTDTTPTDTDPDKPAQPDDGSDDSAIPGEDVPPTTDATSGYVPLDSFTGLKFRTIQDGTATALIWDETTTTTTTVGVVTTTMATSPMEITDSANTPVIYFDVYFTDVLGDTAKDTSIVSQINVDEDQLELEEPAIFISPEILLAKVSETEFKIGKIYYWRVVAKDAQGRTLADHSDIITFTPPRRYTISELRYDLMGWHLDYVFPDARYETLQADVYLASGTAAAAVVSASPVIAQFYDADGDTDEDTVIKHYFTPIVGTTYYSYLVTRDQNASTLVSAGNTENIRALKSASVDSAWNFCADDSVDESPGDMIKQLVSTSSTAVSNRIIDISWENLIPANLTSDIFTVDYTVNIGTSPTALTAASYTTTGHTSGGDRPYVSALGLSFNTPYYAQVIAVGNYANGSSVALADRTWESPIIRFTTPNCLTMGEYTFDSGSVIPTAASLYVPGEIVSGAGGSEGGSPEPVNYGNPAPSLSMLAYNVITTTMTSEANTYTGATLKFDFKPSSETDIWMLTFDNLSAVTAFDPTSYIHTSPSTQYASIHGPVVALQYYSDDPTTTTTSDPVYAVYVYTLMADNTVDIDVGTTGIQGDADTSPDVVRTQCSVNFVTYTAGIAGNYKKWHTIEVYIDTNTVGQNVEITLNGTAATDVSFSGFRTSDSNCINIQGMNSMTLSAISDVLVDNVQYTAENKSGATVIPYLPSIR